MPGANGVRYVAAFEVWKEGENGVARVASGANGDEVRHFGRYFVRLV